MEQDKQADAAPGQGAATWQVEAVVAALVIVFGLVVLGGSWKLGSGWTTDGPGPGYFPFYIGLILCASGAGILLQTLLGKAKNMEVFADREQLRRVMAVLIPAIVYVLVVQFLGLYVASAAYIALFMVFIGKYSKVKSAIVALATMTLFFMMFEVWFKVPLFKGKFDPLAFLGY